MLSAILLLLTYLAASTKAFALHGLKVPSRSTTLSQAPIADETLNTATSSELPNDSLTKAELNARFRDVLAHFQATGELSNEQALENLLRTRLPQLALNRCRIGPSPFHGSGVFATRAIAPGELVTCYPGDALLLWDEMTPTSAQTAASQGMRVLLAPHLANQDAASCFMTNRRARDYEIRVWLLIFCRLGLLSSKG